MVDRLKVIRFWGLKFQHFCCYVLNTFCCHLYTCWIRIRMYSKQETTTCCSGASYPAQFNPRDLAKRTPLHYFREVIYGIILANYIGMIISHYKDPHKPTRISMESKARVFFRGSANFPEVNGKQKFCIWDEAEGEGGWFFLFFLGGRVGKDTFCHRFLRGSDSFWAFHYWKALYIYTVSWVFVEVGVCGYIYIQYVFVVT